MWFGYHEVHPKASLKSVQFFLTLSLRACSSDMFYAERSETDELRGSVMQIAPILRR